jgi:uncharacterized surface protein with fasciclin (FAS1) repeats
MSQRRIRIVNRIAQTRTSRRIFGAGVAASALAVAFPAGIAGAQARDIVDTAVAAGQFTTLARALQAAGLVDTLKGPGPFTVFAPTDAAFAKLPTDRINAILANPQQLRALLTYHVVPGRVTGADVVRLQTARTVLGESVRVNAAGGTVRINDSTVTNADVATSNGVIHVIDTVLLPPSIIAGLPRTGGAAGVAAPVALAVAGLAAAGFGLRARLKGRADDSAPDR